MKLKAIWPQKDRCAQPQIALLSVFFYNAPVSKYIRPTIFRHAFRGLLCTLPLNQILTILKIKDISQQSTFGHLQPRLFFITVQYTVHRIYQNLYLVRTRKKAAGATRSFPVFLSVTRNVPALVFDDSSSKKHPVYVLLRSCWCWGCGCSFASINVLHLSTFCFQDDVIKRDKRYIIYSVLKLALVKMRVPTLSRGKMLERMSWLQLDSLVRLFFWVSNYELVVRRRRC